MATKIKACKVREMIRKSESGELDQARVLKLIDEIGEVATAHPGHNLLFDLRDTELTSGAMGDIVEASMKARRIKALHGIKMAGVVPDEAIRSFIASRVEGMMQWKGMDNRVSNNLDEATAWLSEEEGDMEDDEDGFVFDEKMDGLLLGRCLCSINKSSMSMGFVFITGRLVLQST